MALVVAPDLLSQIHADGERSYPAEGAGLLLGLLVGEEKLVRALLPLANAREETARYNRYLLSPEDYMKGELEAARLGLDNVIFAGVVSKKEMPEAVAGADVCLAILQNIPMFRTTYPNKVFDYMAAGKATILVIDGVIRELVEKSGGGIYVPPGDDTRLAETILELSINPTLLAQMGKAAREYMLKYMDRKNK